jgi:methanogenic corrinoid protein MtbC1
MGARMVADAFELGGWATMLTGPDTRTDAVIRHIREFRPDLVGFSASLPRQLPVVRQTVGELRALFGEACPKIVVGGLAFNHFPNLANWVGATILATDAVGAVAAATVMFTAR